MQVPASEWQTGLEVGWYRFGLRCQTALHLGRFPGSRLRGAIGGVLRRLVCITRQPTCEGCILRGQCAYGHLFETIHAAPGEDVSRFKDAPRPYVLHLPEPLKPSYEAGEVFHFEVVLIGRAVANLPHLVYALRGLEKSGLGGGHKKGLGRFELCEVTARHPTEPFSLLVGPHGNLGINPLPSPLEMLALRTWPASADTLTVQLQTPLRLMHQRMWVGTDDFSLTHLVRALYWRMRLLVRFHGATEGREGKGEALEALCGGLHEEKRQLRWHDRARYSHRQEQAMPMGGLRGRITYRGNIAPLLPLLEAGRLLHVGKGTTMGMGQYGFTLS